MAYCSQCGTDCANAPFCSQCGARVGASVSDASINKISNLNAIDANVSDSLIDKSSNPYAVGAQTSAYSSRSYDSNAPDIPDFSGAIATCSKKCFSFKGRASRSEYWFWVLFLGVVYAFLGIGMFTAALCDLAPFAALLFFLGVVWAIGSFCVSVSVSVRRLHDIDRSGWYWWVGCIPCVGWIMLLVWHVQVGTRGENRFGLEPQERRR